MKKGKLKQVIDVNLVFRAYAEQTEALNRMRGMLEDENTSKR